MKPDKLSVHDLFQRERRYVVPLYQRAYVWSKDEQWEPLWEDIERQAEACLEAESGVPPRSHFLGAIVLNVAKIVGAGVPRSEIIDGQQRLTTLQLFVAALRDYAVSVGSNQASRLRRLTINEDEPAGSEGGFKVWPTNADRETFRNVMMAGSVDAVLKAFDAQDASGLTRLAGAYVYFSRQIAQFSGVGHRAGETEGEGQDRRLFGLLQALRTALQLVVIELEESDDPQVIFETLNARGQPLLPSDLIRNYIFLQAANDPALDPDQLYDSYWRPFDDLRLPEAIDGENRFWHVEERQGRLTRPRIDLFMFHYLVMKTERDLNIGALFREFRDWRDAAPQAAKDFLADLESHSKIFAQLIAPSGEDRLAIFARRLKALDNSTVYPLLLFILSQTKDRLSTAERDQILKDLESWLVRRFVCGLTAKNYNRFFVSLLGKLKQADAVVRLSDLVRAELSRSDDVSLSWPDDVQFLHGWKNTPVYVRSRADRSGMLLRALEAHIRTNKNEAVSLPEKLTVEHLLPQKGSMTDYPFAAEMPLAAGETSERCRARLINTVGNLTLLTGELNSSASNGPFPDKVTKIVADSDLRLNAWLRTYPPSVWAEDAILERAESLFSNATAIWSAPERVKTNEISATPPELTEADIAFESNDGSWRDDVRAALTTRGGTAPLWAIYAEVELIRRAAGRSIPPSLDAIVRRTLEEGCAETESFKGVANLFLMPEGKGAGIWALRALSSGSQ